MQDNISKMNEVAWNQLAYEAWICRFGTPKEAAAKIMSNPSTRLGSIYNLFGDIKGKKIANLLGSHGSKAVALSLLGANVTVIDFSYENSRYAMDLARECRVSLNYIVKDVLSLDQDELTGDYDIVFSELGILHYFLDLHPFFNVANKLLHNGGKIIIQDFHPVSTKLITSKGKKHKVTGDYFNTSLYETDVAYMKYVPGLETLTEDEKNAFQKVNLRKWTLGEIISAIADEGFCIKSLEESENNQPDDKGIPKLFSVSAVKSE